MTNHPIRYVFRGFEKPGVFVHAIGHGSKDVLLELCAENKAPYESPYICFVPVRDFWRMDAQVARNRQVWHYSTGIESQVLSDVRARRCALVFDLSNEGPAYDEDIFGELMRWIASNSLPSEQIVWLSQNQNIEKYCRARVGSHAQVPRFEQYDFFIKSTASLFASGSGLSVSGAGIDSYINSMFDRRSKDKILLCLNASAKPWRVLTLGALIVNGLLENSLVSFPDVGYAKGFATGYESVEVARQFAQSKASLAYLRDSVEATLLFSNLTVDKFSEKGNALHDKIDVHPYQRTYFSLVSETDFTDGAVARVTEKIIKAFGLGHPVIVIGNPRSLPIMSQLGFKTWDDVIDSSYDSTQDPPSRFNQLFEEVKRIENEIRADAENWLSRVREHGAHNIRYAFGGGFLQHYREIYDIPLVRRLGGLIGAPQSSGGSLN